MPRRPAAPPPEPNVAAIDAAKARADAALDAYETKRDAIMLKMQDLASSSAARQKVLVQEWFDLAKQTDAVLMEVARALTGDTETPEEDFEPDPRLGDAPGDLADALGGELEAPTILQALLDGDDADDAFPPDCLEESSEMIEDMAAEARGDEE